MKRHSTKCLSRLSWGAQF